jgi:hypothetical protein
MKPLEFQRDLEHERLDELADDHEREPRAGGRHLPRERPAAARILGFGARQCRHRAAAAARRRGDGVECDLHYSILHT